MNVTIYQIHNILNIYYNHSLRPPLIDVSSDLDTAPGSTTYEYRTNMV